MSELTSLIQSPERSTLSLDSEAFSGRSDQEPQAAEEVEWRIKATPWRMVNSVFLLGAGIWKVVCAYRGDSTANALDFAIGALWALISYWLSIFETESPGIFPLLFEHDVRPLASAMFIAACLTTISTLCLFLYFSTVERIEHNLNITMVLPLKALLELVILMGIIFLIRTLLWLLALRLPGMPIFIWDITTLWFGQPAYMLIFVLSAVLSGMIAILTPVRFLIGDIFTISEDMGFTVGFTTIMGLAFIGIYLTVGFALMIARAVSKKMD